MKKYFAAAISAVFLFTACSNTETSIQNTNHQETTELSDFATAAAEGMENAQQITLDCTFGEMTGNYAGEMKNNLPHGTGKFVSQNENQSGWYYEGDFVEGHFEGTGKTVFENGQIQQGKYIKDIWHPSTIQFFEFMQTLPGSNFTINQKAREIFEGEKNYFPVESEKELSNITDDTITYQDMIANPNDYGDKFMSVSNLSIFTHSTFSVTENPESLPELRGAYIEASGADGENYALYYRGNVSGVLKEGSIVNSAVGLPLSIMQKTDDSGVTRTYIVMAVSFLSLQQNEEVE